jgi:hypothetical protein
MKLTEALILKRVSRFSQSGDEFQEIDAPVKDGLQNGFNLITLVTQQYLPPRILLP